MSIADDLDEGDHEEIDRFLVRINDHEGLADVVSGLTIGDAHTGRVEAHGLLGRAVAVRQVARGARARRHASERPYNDGRFA